MNAMNAMTAKSAATAEAIRHGHTMGTINNVRTIALSDAALFAQDHPGEPLSGDWDFEAWCISDKDALLVKDHIGFIQDNTDALWPVYREVLHAAVNQRLRKDDNTNIRVVP